MDWNLGSKGLRPHSSDLQAYVGAFGGFAAKMHGGRRGDEHDSCVYCRPRGGMESKTVFDVVANELCKENVSSEEHAVTR